MKLRTRTLAILYAPIYLLCLAVSVYNAPAHHGLGAAVPVAYGVLLVLGWTGLLRQRTRRHCWWVLVTVMGSVTIAEVFGYGWVLAKSLFDGTAAVFAFMDAVLTWVPWLLLLTDPPSGWRTSAHGPAAGRAGPA